MIQKGILTVALLMLLFASYGQSGLVGTWKTIDDETGEAKSHVEIYQQNGKFYGKIIKLLAADPGVLCDKCDGKKKDKPVMGMVIVDGLQVYKDYWKKGTILDPKSGNEYKCSMWFEEGQTDALKVRGHHWTGLYRTQTWYRVEE